MRIALVGYGRFAPRHLEALRALGCDVVAAANRSEKGRAAAASEGKIAKTYADPLEMVEREKPDGVVVCASYDQISKVATRLLDARVPLLLEKPPAVSLDELEALIAKRAQTGGKVMVALNRRHYSVVHSALADAGGREALRTVSVDWSEDPQAFLARGMSQAQVEKLIFANSLHGLDLLTFLAGPVEAPQIAATSDGVFGWRMALAGVSARGVLVTFRSTWDAPARWRLEASTDRRRYVFAPLEGCEVQERGNNATRKLEPSVDDQKLKPGMVAQARAFLALIRGEPAAVDCSLESTVPAMRLASQLTQACLNAAVAGRHTAGGR